jgi:hypothetical protein
MDFMKRFTPTVGTKSVLFGVHAFWIHPVLTAIAWWKLYGFPWDPRLWACFFLHDIGYWGKPNMNGPEGETHPVLGAKIVGWLFGPDWEEFCVTHSRHYAKKMGKRISPLAIADKYVQVIEPSWLYIPRAVLSGEMDEYLTAAANQDTSPNIILRNMRWAGRMRSAKLWHQCLRAYMTEWVAQHKDGV